MQPQGQAAEYNYTTQPANYIVSQVNMPQQYPGQPLLLSQLNTSNGQQDLTHNPHVNKTAPALQEMR